MVQLQKVDPSEKSCFLIMKKPLPEENDTCVSSANNN